MRFIFFEHSFLITKGNHNTVFVESFVCVDALCPSQQFFTHDWTTSWHVCGSVPIFFQFLNIVAPGSYPYIHFIFCIRLSVYRRLSSKFNPVKYF